MNAKVLIISYEENIRNNIAIVVCGSDGDMVRSENDIKLNLPVEKINKPSSMRLPSSRTIIPHVKAAEGYISPEAKSPSIQRGLVGVG